MWWSMKRYLRKWFRICFLELSQHYLILQKLEVLRQMLVGNLWISRREDILIWTQESLSRTKNWCPHSWRLSRSRSGRKPRLCNSRSRAYVQLNKSRMPRLGSDSPVAFVVILLVLYLVQALPWSATSQAFLLKLLLLFHCGSNCLINYLSCLDKTILTFLIKIQWKTFHMHKFVDAILVIYLWRKN